MREIGLPAQVGNEVVNTEERLAGTRVRVRVRGPGDEGFAQSGSNYRCGDRKFVFLSLGPDSVEM